MNHWLLKSEPTSYSIADLKRDKCTAWTGVRNYQARNTMRDLMKVGDLCLFYHSNAEPPGVAGLCRVVRKAHADPTATDKKDEHFDPKSTKEEPIWMCVDVEFVEGFKEVVGLDAIKANPKLKDIMVAARGSRLSVQPVSGVHFREILAMAGSKA
ncbi:MAG: EVE domain-containing protein [Planctomycetota bacterium]